MWRARANRRRRVLKTGTGLSALTSVKALRRVGHPLASAFSISRRSTLSIFSGVTGPTSL